MSPIGIFFIFLLFLNGIIFGKLASDMFLRKYPSIKIGYFFASWIFIMLIYIIIGLLPLVY